MDFSALLERQAFGHTTVESMRARFSVLKAYQDACVTHNRALEATVKGSLQYQALENALRWSTNDYLQGDKEAGDHARSSGHTIKGEYGFSVTIEP